VKVAVVGSGISGLVCAHLLSREHEVHVFEAADFLGGHTHTVDIQTPSGKFAIDTGFIVFNNWTYPNFVKLLDRMGVRSQESAMSFSVKTEESGLEYNGTDMNRLFAQRSNLFRPSFHRMIRDILRFNRESVKLLEGSDDLLSLGDYLTTHRYSREFIEDYVIPMGAAVWSSSVEQMLGFPARYFVQFFKNHGFLAVNERPVWRVVSGGSRSYHDPLTTPFRERIRLNTPVLAIQRLDDGVRLKLGGRGVGETDFDQVILASHSDQALKLLSEPSPLEREVLGAFVYQRNETVLHTDTSVMPRRKLAWAAWNYLVPKVRQNTVSVTYDMNILQGIEAPETFLVSLNLETRLDPEKVLRRFTYHHPVYTPRAVGAQKRWSEISGKSRTHFCGAYWGYGFHEDGVSSALRVCESFGVKL